jgi:NAD(P)-dependent dehydrogenase (short-subunit alcohol dehydrogenase family)
MFDFKNKVAIITGGARGIGKCIREEMEKKGAKVYIIDIADNDCYVGDIGCKETLEAFTDKVVSECGSVDYLINNAPPKFTGVDSCSYEDFEYALRIGVTSAFYLSKLLLPYFNKGASIVNISSSRDRMSQPQSESYAAAKGGIMSLTKALAKELGEYKINVNSVAPGVVMRPGENASEDRALKTNLLGEKCYASDIANLVEFLVSDKARFITGQTYVVDGGRALSMKGTD